jgi:hypothetical protein
MKEEEWTNKLHVSMTTRRILEFQIPSQSRDTGVVGISVRDFEGKESQQQI